MDRHRRTYTDTDRQTDRQTHACAQKHMYAHKCTYAHTHTYICTTTQNLLPANFLKQLLHSTSAT